MTPTSSRQGSIAELKLQVFLAERGFLVSRPVGDGYSYDIVADLGGKLTRIQIKASSRHVKNNYAFSVFKSNRQPYSKKDCDVIATYLEKKDEWYFFPVNILSKIKTLSIRTNNDTKSIYSKYKNNLGVFK